MARMPGLSDLGQKTILFAGLGALGAPAAIHAARAGVGRVALLDFDYVDPATVRRWPIGASAFGTPKPDAIEEMIGREYPWTETTLHHVHIGGLSGNTDTRNQFDEIADLIKSADLIIDLTAESGVNQMLSTVARQFDRPYIVASATPGAWGGYVARFTNEPGSTCWTCLTHDLYGDDWAEDLPPEDPEGTKQPPGCPARTFTGTSVDLEEISLEVFRLALGILSDGYPLPVHQLEILSHRRDGARTPPSWKMRAIQPRPACSCQT